MSDKPEQEVPYLTLGSRLKRLREQVKETLAEVAGAVEIDSKVMQDFENGQNRPSEDILELLISHFSLQNKEADKLWELAGYEAPIIDSDAESHITAPTIVVVPVDSRISYTDLSHVAANPHGVVINFMQSSGGGTNSKPLVISRVGMSPDQAKQLQSQLNHALRDLEPKALPAKIIRTTKTPRPNTKKK